MEKEQIRELFEQFENARYDLNGTECWSARELQVILGYTKWNNFLNVIEKAKKSCENAVGTLSDHFADVGKMIELAKGAQREIEDIALRRQEIIEQRMLDIARVNAREKLSKSEKKLSGIIYERGVDEKGFALIRSKGDQALFGGFSTNEMKKKLQIADNRPLADFLPTLTIKAKDFATELTSHNVTEKDLRGPQAISNEHVDNNKAVRKMLMERGVKPEQLPPSEDLKKVQRKLEGDEKQVLRDAQKKKKG